MRKQKQQRLRAKGWKVGTVKEFLGLSNEESAYIDLKIKLAAGQNGVKSLMTHLYRCRTTEHYFSSTFFTISNTGLGCSISSLTIPWT